MKSDEPFIFHKTKKSEKNIQKTLDKKGGGWYNSQAVREGGDNRGNESANIRKNICWTREASSVIENWTTKREVQSKVYVKA